MAKGESESVEGRGGGKGQQNEKKSSVEEGRRRKEVRVEESNKNFRSVVSSSRATSTR